MHPLYGQQSFFRSFLSAFRGFAHAGTGRNLLVLLGASIAAYALMVFFGVDAIMRSIVLLSCVITLAAEMLNTAIEELSDTLIKDHHPGIAKTKELAASAVLLLATATLLITLYALYSAR